jgi:hypothetical protein
MVVRDAHALVRSHRKSPGIPRAMVLTVSFGLSSVTGFLATVAPEKLASQELDASIGASGPHDFSVRIRRARLAAPSTSTASRPALMTLRNAPPEGQDGDGYRFDLG